MNKKPERLVLKIRRPVFEKIACAGNLVGLNEITFWGVMKDFIVEDVYLPKQKVSSTSVEVDVKDTAQYVEEMSAKGYSMQELMSCQIHKHPEGCLSLSDTDMQTFSNLSEFNHSVMVIFTGKSCLKAWVCFNDSGYKAMFEIPVEIIPDQKIEEETQKLVKEKVFEATLPVVSVNKFDYWKAKYKEIHPEEKDNEDIYQCEVCGKWFTSDDLFPVYGRRMCSDCESDICGEDNQKLF